MSGRPRPERVNRRLDSGRIGALRGVTRVAHKSVVHSGNVAVTGADPGVWPGCITGLFHAQLFVLQGYSRVGTFFTNLCRGLVFTGLRASCRWASTDLSTTRVDKHESPFASDSCVIYVMVTRGMMRNFHPFSQALSGAETESAFGAVTPVRFPKLPAARRRPDVR